MDTKTKVILVIIAILVPGIFFQQFFNLGFMVDLETYSYGTITMPTIIVGAIFFGELLPLFMESMS